MAVSFEGRTCHLRPYRIGRHLAKLQAPVLSNGSENFFNQVIPVGKCLLMIYLDSTDNEEVPVLSVPLVRAKRNAEQEKDVKTMAEAPKI